MRTIASADGDLDFAVADRQASVEQRVAQRLRFAFGEWFLDTSKGTRVRELVVGKLVDPALAQQAISAEIRQVEDVANVIEARYTPGDANRRARYVAQVQTLFGPMSIEQEF